jgi:hypothetical protein
VVLLRWCVLALKAAPGFAPEVGSRYPRGNADSAPVGDVPGEHNGFG